VSKLAPDDVVRALQSARALESADESGLPVLPAELSVTGQGLARARERVAATLLPGLAGEAGHRVRDQFEQASAEYERALTAAAAEVHAAAVRQSAIEGPRLRQAVDALGTGLGALPAAPPNAQRTLLNVPFQIVSTPGLVVDGRQAVPSASFAKFRFETTQRQGAQSVSFDFFWQNLAGKFVVLDVLGFVVVSGHVQVRSSGGFFAGNRSCSARVNANLKVTEFFHPAPVVRVAEGATALQVSCSSGGMFSDGASKAATVFRGFGLQGHLFVVPTDGVLVFSAEAQLTHGAGQDGDSRVRADFSSGDFQVMSPAVLVTIVS
jgi:hypothetical protein